MQRDSSVQFSLKGHQIFKRMKKELIELAKVLQFQFARKKVVLFFYKYINIFNLAIIISSRTNAS